MADERAVIQKESAAIRTSFREDYSDQSIRKQNVAKLLYLFTLGERTHFGQVECLKLLASSKFSDKRLGYLGTMLLLDENQQVLTLVTNSLANDLNHPNQNVVGLALCTLGNIAGTEMSRDLFADVEKILGSSNPYLRKKAALCAMRIIDRVPELEENFLDKAKLLVNEKNHGLLLCGMALIQTMCDNNPDHIVEFKPIIPTLIKHLKSLLSSGYAPEHDVIGISDPFLQVKILQLLRLLGAGDPQSSELMSDILAQIASNTDSAKNVGSAVLYEAVRTIFGIEADSGLRVLGVNILGQFLSTKDNNIRYVALNTLLQVIEVEATAVQRHRATIIECLQDPDISIRRRALDLSFALINDQNIRVLVRELLAFLETADNEFKTNLISQVAMAAEKYAPNKRWHVDTILRMLKLAGSYAKENVLSAFITLVITTEELHLYTVQKLYAGLKNDISQEGLNLVGVWLIGEYAHKLLKGGSYEEEDLVQEVTETDIVSLMETILDSSFSSDVVKEYTINSLIKLTTRISSPAEIERIRRMLQRYSKSLNVEIQQRVVEYGQLFAYDSVRKGVLETMPAPEIRDDLSKQYQKAKKANARQRTSRTTTVTTAGGSVDLLLDLASDVGEDLISSTPQPTANNSDLLADIFGSSGGEQVITSGPAEIVAPVPKKSAKQNILDLFASTTSSSPATTPAAQPSSQSLDGLFGVASAADSDAIEAYNANSLKLTFAATNDGPGAVTIQANFVNQSVSSSISNLVLQVAVPKTQKLQLQGLSSSTLSPGASATQLMKVTGAAGTNVRLRLRISFAVDGQTFQEQLDFNKFPPALL